MRTFTPTTLTLTALLLSVSCAPEPPGTAQNGENSAPTLDRDRTGVEKFFLHLPNDTVGCRFRPGTRHPDPVQLIEQYVSRVTNGQIARRDDVWLAQAVFCPARVEFNAEPRVIRSHTVTILEREPDHVRARIDYDGAGYMRLTNVSPDSVHFVTAESTASETLDVVQTPHGWRIITVDPYQHLSFFAAQRLPQTQASRNLIEQAPRTRRPVEPRQRAPARRDF